MLEYKTNFSSYIAVVISQMRCKTAHRDIIKELQSHLEEQQEFLMEEEGMEEKAAEIESIHRMGDPTFIGKQLDKIHRPKVLWPIVLMFLYIFVFIAAIQLRAPLNQSYLMLMNCFGLLLGYGLYKLDYFALYKTSYIAYGFVLMLSLVLTLVNPISSLPANFSNHLLLICIPFATSILYHKKNKGYCAFILSYSAFIIPCGLAYLKKDYFMLLLLSICSIQILWSYTIQNRWKRISKLAARTCMAFMFFVFVTSFVIIGKNSIGQRNGTFTGSDFIQMYSNNVGLKIIGHCDAVSGIWLRSYPFISKHLYSIASADVPYQYDASYMFRYISVWHGILMGIILLALLLAMAAMMHHFAKRQSNPFAAALTKSISLVFFVQLLLSALFNYLGGDIYFTLSAPFSDVSNMVVGCILLGIFLSACKWNGVASEARFDTQKNKTKEIVT